MLGEWNVEPARIATPYDYLLFPDSYLLVVPFSEKPLLSQEEREHNREQHHRD